MKTRRKQDENNVKLMLYQVKETIKKITPKALISAYHLILSFLGALFYGFPSRKLIVIGVTGTNGKSTVIDLITRILEQAGHKTAALSSIVFKIGSQEQPNMLKMTMPGRWQLQKLLRQAVKAKCKYAVLEVTSEGIKQHRHRFIKFNTAVFTNLSPEHIEAHHGFKNYREAKLKLFKTTKKTHIVNLDDENVKYFLSIPSNKKFGFSLQSQKSAKTLLLCSSRVLADLKILQTSIIEVNSFGTAFKIKGENFNLRLLGSFNIYNALAAICVGISQGINLETCKNALEQADGIPGRMEKVISSPFEVFVDYAFTPNALKKVYQTLKPKAYELICVLGACGGGRDKWKRPVLGQIAENYCDHIIITNEDPYDEDPMDIINQISQNCPKAEKILDRRQAIKKALTIAKPNDKVIITGKGCEPWICVAGNKKIPWDDRQVVREEFKSL